MTSRTLFWLSLATLAAATPAAGQLPVLPMQRNLNAWPSEVTRAGMFGRTIAANVTGHNAPDIVLLDGKEPRLITAPGIHNAIGPLPMKNAPTTTNDVATLVGRGAIAGTDALALVGPLGLRVWQRNPLDGVVTITQLVDSSWNNAKAVATHPLDSGIIFGLDSAGRRVRSVVDSNGSWQSSATITTATSILAIGCIDWDGHANGQTELAVLTTTALTVYSRTGSVLRNVALSPSVSSGSITRVRAPNHTGEWLACVTPKPAPGGSLLQVIAHDIAVPQVVDLGSTSFVAVTAGDCTIDGREDLVLTSNTSVEATILFNLYTGPTQGTVFAMQTSTGVRIQMNNPDVPFANVANALVLDLDNDGDGDFFAPVETEGGAILAARSTLYLPSITVDEAESTPTMPLADVTVWFSQPASQATHTQFVIWRVGANGVMEPLAERPPILVPIAQSQVTLTDVDMAFLELGKYALMVRPVVAVVQEPAPLILQVGPAYLGSIWGRRVDGGNVEVGGVSPQPVLPPAPPSPPPNPNPQ